MLTCNELSPNLSDLLLQHCFEFVSLSKVQPTIETLADSLIALVVLFQEVGY